VVERVFAWLRRGVLLLLTLAAALLAGGWIFQEAATWRQRGQFPPPGRMVATSGRRLHVVASGAGAPTVVFEAPIGGSHLAWAAVAPAVSRHSRVVTYDRAGYGWSDPAPPPRTAGAIVEDLRRMLREGGEVGPFVLVGHSFGGLIVRLYVLRHPEEVEGLVLVDPTHEAMNEQLPSAKAEAEAFRKTLVGFRLAVRVGALRLLDMPLGEGSAAWCPAELRPAARAAGFRTSWVDAVAAEVDGLDASLGQTAEAAASAGPLPLGDAPVVILSSGRPSEPPGWDDYEATLRLHHDLLRMSSHSRHQVVEGAGHFIQVDRPDVVTSAIREVLDWSREPGGGADRRSGPSPEAPRSVRQRSRRDVADVDTYESRQVDEGRCPVLGFVFVLFIVVVGVATVVAAAGFALRPQERTLAILRPLSASTAFAASSALLAGAAMALKNGADGALSAEALRTLVAGLAEACVAGVLGFALLGVAWLLVAVGFRRQT
jgi:pimeloyl-ACP methyl ester carboxylesterase